MAVNRYSTPTQFQQYQPTSVQDYTTPLMMEAQAKGAQGQLLGAMSTGYDGFDFDKEQYADSVGDIENKKTKMMESIIAGDQVSGSELYDLTSDYNKLYGANGDITKAKSNHAKYISEMQAYAKTADKYDPGVIKHYSDKALQAYKDDRSLGFSMGNLVQHQDFDGTVNSVVKTMSANNTVTQETIAAQGWKKIQDPTIPNTYVWQKKGSTRTYSTLEMQGDLVASTVAGKLSTDPKMVAWLTQQAEVTGVPVEKLLQNSIAINMQMERKNKVTYNDSQGTPKDGSELPGGVTGNHNLMANGKGIAKNSFEIQQSINTDRKGARAFIAGSQDPISRTEYEMYNNKINVALAQGNTLDAQRMAEKLNLGLKDADFMPQNIEATRAKVNAQLSAKMANSSDMSHRGKKIASDAANQYNKSHPKHEEKVTASVKPLTSLGLDESLAREYADYYNDSYNSTVYGSDEFAVRLMRKMSKDGIDVSTQMAVLRNIEDAADAYSDINNKKSEYVEKAFDDKARDYEVTNTYDFVINPDMTPGKTKILNNKIQQSVKTALQNSSAGGINIKKGDLFGNSDWDDPNQIDFSKVTYEEVGVSEDGKQVVIRMSAKYGDDGDIGYEDVTYDVSSREGRLAVANLIDQLPPGPVKSMLNLQANNPNAGGISTDYPQNSGYSSKGYPVTYNKDATGELVLTKTDAQMGTQVDLTDTFYHSQYINELKRSDPTIGGKLNSFLVESMKLYPANGGKRAQHIKQRANEVLLRTDDNPNGLTQTQVDLLLINPRESSPEQIDLALSKLTDNAWRADIVDYYKNLDNPDQYVRMQNYIKNYGK